MKMEYLALSLTSLTQSDRGAPARPALAPDAPGDFAQAMDQAARPEGVIDPGVALTTSAPGTPLAAGTITAPLPGAAQPGQAPLGDLAAILAPSAIFGQAGGTAPVALAPVALAPVALAPVALAPVALAPVALAPLPLVPLAGASGLPATQPRPGEGALDPIASPVPRGPAVDPGLAGVAGVPVSPGAADAAGVAVAAGAAVVASAASGMVPAQPAPLPMAAPVAAAVPMPPTTRRAEAEPQTPDDGGGAAPPVPVVAGQTPEVPPPPGRSQEEASPEPAPSAAVQALPAAVGTAAMGIAALGIAVGTGPSDSPAPMAVGYAALPGTAGAPEGRDMPKLWRGLARAEGVTVADLPGQRGGAVVMPAPEAPLTAALQPPIRPAATQAELPAAPTPVSPGGEAAPAPGVPVRDAMFRLSRLVVPEAWAAPTDSRAAGSGLVGSGVAGSGVVGSGVVGSGVVGSGVVGSGVAPVASGPAVPGGAAPAPVPAAPAQPMQVTIDTTPLARSMAALAPSVQAAAPAAAVAPAAPTPGTATATQPLAALSDPAPDPAAQPGGMSVPATAASTTPVLAAAPATATPPRPTRPAPDPARVSAEPGATTGRHPGLEAKPVPAEAAGLDPAPKPGLSRMAPHQSLIGSDLFAGSLPTPPAPTPTPSTGAVAAAGTPAAPDFARHVTAQIAHGVADAPGQDRIALRLDPPELGGIDIGLDLRDQTLRVTISADRASTGELIRRHADQLISDFADAGFVGIDLSFSGQNQPRRDALAQSLLLHPESPGRILVPVDPAPVPAAASRAAASDSGLDLRL